MTSEDVPPLGPDEFPLPFGIEAETGAPLPGLTNDDLTRVDADESVVRGRGQPGAAERLATSQIDPNNLEEAGWCVVFHQQTDPQIKAALAPLLMLRERQANRLFKVFEGSAAIKSGESARDWVERHGASLAMVDPENGVPLYVLLVGSPTQIPFEFQYLLDLYWNVGRLHFDTPAEYTVYADHVVAYENANVPPLKKRSAFFVTRNAGDRPTGLLHNQLAGPLVNAARGSDRRRTLDGFEGFKLTALLAEDATRQNLRSLLRSKDAPAFLFTGSHGVKFKMTDPAQRDNQGALLCQDWPGFGPTAKEHLFTADDVPDDANVHGLIHFLFACYGGGCPRDDNFGLAKGQAPRQLVDAPIIARLPQRLLTRGALASLAHVDRAWAYSFQNSRSLPQVQEMREVMVRILKGQRIGQATDGFNMRWAVLSAELDESQNPREASDTQLVSNAALANRFIARNDARNYIVIGDPAVQLRTRDMVD